MVYIWPIESPVRLVILITTLVKVVRTPLTEFRILNCYESFTPINGIPWQKQYSRSEK